MPTLSGITKYFSTSKEGFTTTLASTISSGATTVQLNSTTGYTNGDQVALCIDPASASAKQVFYGEVSGVNIINVVWTEGTNQTHSAGATVVDYASATHWDAQKTGLLTSLDQDGTLKAGAVDNTAVIASGVVEQLNLREKLTDYQIDFVLSGGVVAKSSGLIGTFSNMAHYIGGVKYLKSSVANKTYTVSKDTYLDATSASDATITYTEVANGAASPSLAAGSIRIAKVVTDGTGITGITQSGFDSIGYQFYPNLIPKVDAVTGWNTAGETWTYVSASTFTVPMDVTGKYPVGTKISWVQTTVKYGHVLSTSYAVATGLTTVTIVTNTDYTLANAAITIPRYSYAEVPQGFPQWFNYSPTWGGMTIGNGTNASKYAINGRTVTCTPQVTFGTTSSMSTSVNVTLPVTPATLTVGTPIGTAIFADASPSAEYLAASEWSGTVVIFYCQNVSGTYSTMAGTASTVPFTWTTSDKIVATLVYQI